MRKKFLAFMVFLGITTFVSCNSPADDGEDYAL